MHGGEPGDEATLATLTDIPNISYVEYWFTKHFVLSVNAFTASSVHHILWIPSLSY